MKLVKKVVVHLMTKVADSHEFIKVDFSKEVLCKLIEKTKDMYCLIPAVQSILQGFLLNPEMREGTIQLREQIFGEAEMVNGLFKSLTTPQLNLP
jgi:hypothetical protein